MRSCVLPGKAQCGEPWMHRRHFDDEPFPLGHLLKLFNSYRLHRAAPGLDRFIKDPERGGDRMQAQVIADIWIGEPRSLQQRR